MTGATSPPVTLLYANPPDSPCSRPENRESGSNSRSMSISYNYWGEFTRVATTPGLQVYGFPQNANINYFNVPNTTPLVQNSATVSATLFAPFASEATDRSAAAAAVSRPVSAPQTGVAVLICGGESGYSNAFGVSFSTSNTVTNPSTLTNRIIIIPNTKSTASGTPPVDPLEVMSNQTFCLPMNPSTFTTIGTDVMGTPIVSASNGADYDKIGSDPLFVYFFIIPQGWKYSGTDWYVDTTIVPFWSGTSVALNSDARFHTAIGTIAGPTAFNASNVVSVTSTNAVGFEDLTNLTGVIVPSTNTWLDYNEIVFSIINLNN